MTEYKRQTEVPDEDGFYFAEIREECVANHDVEVVEIASGWVLRAGLGQRDVSKEMVAYYLPAIELPKPPRAKPAPGMYAVRCFGEWRFRIVEADSDSVRSPTIRVLERDWRDPVYDWDSAKLLEEG